LDWRQAGTLTIPQASSERGVTVRTLRNWCIEHGLGRHIGSRWRVSCVALAMYLDGNVMSLDGISLQPATPD
jgi:hypothetical protein